MRHLRVVACVLLVVLAVAAPVRGGPRRADDVGRAHLARAHVVRSGRDPGIITPFMVMYAFHDAMAKPMPGNPTAPSLAESWQMSRDGRVYEFMLRKGVKFHNGDPLTSEDVKFSFDRYRGASAKTLKDRVAAVETPTPAPRAVPAEEAVAGLHDVLHARPAARAGSFRRSTSRRWARRATRRRRSAPGPTSSSRSRPASSWCMEAFDGYWRKTPSVKRLVFKVIPDESTRLAALKRGEIDIVYSIRGELAEELQRTPGLTLKPTVIQAPQWVSMLDQWDPKSPWHDRRVRLAANLAIDRKAINQAITLGHSRLTYSIIPSTFDFYWQPPTYAFDPDAGEEASRRGGISRTASTPATTTWTSRTRTCRRRSPTTCSRSASAPR